ncbi:MAG: hypothetical protein IPG94_07150 [Kineosporiaceae bacterium]|nr:hypothetical protein [Kineosporiaceae bacterium]
MTDTCENPPKHTIRPLAVGVAAAALLAPVLWSAPATAVTAVSPSSSVAGSPAAGQRASVGEVTLPAGIRPEGITSGPGSRFYVGSLADGRIVAGDLRTGSSSVLLPGAAGRQLRGLYFDGRTGLVWAAGNVGAVAHVWAVNARTGAVVADVVVPGAVFLNDLVVTRNAVWVTDSRADRLTRIALGRGGSPSGAAPVFVALRGAWPAGDGTAVNANGIRALADGSLILNNSRVGGLWQVDPASGVARQIPISGGPGIVAGDGLELRGSTLYNVRGSGPAEVSVLRLRCDHGAWRATWVRALTDPRLNVPSTATLVGSTLWAVNARFGVADPGTAAYWVTPLAVR